MNKYCYWNGKLVYLDEVKISPYDLGFVRGYGIFDAMRTANGKLFCFSQHWKKIKKSANELEIKLPIGKNKFKKAGEVLLEKNKIKEGAVKTILTAGKSENGFIRGDGSTLIILVDELKNFLMADDFYKNGCKLITLNFQRQWPEIKNLNYLIPIKNQKEKIKNNAQEILYKKNGKILECSTSNIFIVKNNVIITPKKNIFLGTMRDLVIDLAQKNNFKVREQAINESDLFLAEEVFLTATYKKIVPVVNVDGGIIGKGRVGFQTKKLMQLLDNFIKDWSSCEFKRDKIF
jgi:D-amino acid aminotransferase